MMAEQLALVPRPELHPPLGGLTPTDVRRVQRQQQRVGIQEQFETWLGKNPAVWRLFCAYASEARQSGHRHFAAKAIVERMRWHMTVETRGDLFKINNIYTSRLARKLERERPEFQGFFQLRRLHRA